MHRITCQYGLQPPQRNLRHASSTADAVAEDHRFAGVSELCYVDHNDLLLLILSSEATGNACDDCAIGDSYIAWVDHISQKLDGRDISLNGIRNLSEADPAFKGEKIEGVCLSAVTDNGWYLHLVADNVQGESRLFHIKMLMEDLSE